MRDFVIENGVLTKYIGPGGDVVIPDGVTEIKEYAFKDCIELTCISDMKTVNSIGYGAFEGCSELISVSFCADEITIIYGAFSGCKKLSNIEIRGTSSLDSGILGTKNHPAALKLFAPNAVFSDFDAVFKAAACKSFFERAGEYPDKQKSIYQDYIKKQTGRLLSAFSSANDTEAVLGLMGMSSVSYKAAEKAIAAAVRYPETAAILQEYIHAHFDVGTENEKKARKMERALSDDGELTAEELKKTWKTCTLRSGLLIEKYKGAGESKVMIPNKIGKQTVTGIGDSAFIFCSGITDIEIPDSVTEINHAAFQGCTGLTRIALPAELTKICIGVFRDCITLQEVTLPDGLAEIDSYAFDNCVSLTDLELPAGIERIADNAFSSCPNLTIHAPENSYAGQYAAAWEMQKKQQEELESKKTDLQKLKDLWTTKKNADGTLTLTGYKGWKEAEAFVPAAIGKNPITAIGSEAFAGNVGRCKNMTWRRYGLKRVIIPEGITHIGEYAFFCCEGLQTVVIPQSTIEIKSTAFDMCPNLTIHAPAGSAAEAYAQKCELPFKAI